MKFTWFGAVALVLGFLGIYAAGSSLGEEISSQQAGTEVMRTLFALGYIVLGGVSLKRAASPNANAIRPKNAFTLVWGVLLFVVFAFVTLGVIAAGLGALRLHGVSPWVFNVGPLLLLSLWSGKAAWRCVRAFRAPNPQTEGA